MPPTGRRGSMLPQEGQYPKAMTYVGMAAAALGAIAGGFNLYEKNKDQFISGPPRSMPRRIERQILAGSTSSPDDDDEYAAISYAASTSSSRRGEFSDDNLRLIQKHYKKELNESNEEGDWERATHITKTLGMIQQVLNMRDEMSCAIRGGDKNQTVQSMHLKLDKLQKAMEKLIRSDQDYLDERKIESDRANYDPTNGTATRSTRKMEFSSCAESSTSDDFLSKEELIALRSQLQNEMKSVDTKTREGMAEWRLRYKRLKVLEEALDVLDAIDVAKDEEDDEEVFDMRDRLSILQGEFFSEAPTVPAATQNKGFLGLFRGSHASGTPAGNSTREAKASNEKKRPAPKSKAPPRKKVAGSHRPCRTSSGRTTHPPAAFVAGPASRRGNDDTIAGSRADAQLSTSLLTGGGKLPSSSSSTTATTPPNTGRDATTCVSVSCSSSVTSQVKTKEPGAPQPDFVESCPEYGPGWIVKGYERKSGTLKGHLDKYWFSPCGRKLRSRKEVERFLKDDVAANVEGPATNTSNKASRETYVIEKILGRKLNPSNERTEYLIRWRGYPDPTDFTFEPIENLGRRHVDEPEMRWGDSEADPEKIEVNDMQRDGKDVLLYAKLMNLETDVIDHDSGNGDDEYNEDEEKEEEELYRIGATAQDGVETELLDQTAISIDNQVQVSVASVASAASAPSAEINAPLSPESESLSAAKSPVDEEGFQLDEASISSEATRDDTGLLP